MKTEVEKEFQVWLNQMNSKLFIPRFDTSLYVAKFIAQQLPSHVSIKEVFPKS